MPTAFCIWEEFIVIFALIVKRVESILDVPCCHAEPLSMRGNQGQEYQE
jgi:hypothetical protein